MLCCAIFSDGVLKEDRSSWLWVSIGAFSSVGRTKFVVILYRVLLETTTIGFRASVRRT